MRGWIFVQKLKAAIKTQDSFGLAVFPSVLRGNFPLATGDMRAELCFKYPPFPLSSTFPTSTVYRGVLISTNTAPRIGVVTLKPAHNGGRASTVIRVHLVSTSLCALHQIWLIDLRRFQRYDPKPAVYARLALLRAE